MSRVSWPTAVPSKKALQDVAQIRYRLVSGAEILQVEVKNIFAQDVIGWNNFGTVPLDIQFPVSQLLWRISCFSDIYLQSQYKGSVTLKRYMKYYDLILDAVWDHSEKHSENIWPPCLLKWCEEEYNVGMHSLEAVESWMKDHEDEKITFAPENIPDLEIKLDERLGWIYGELADVDWQWDSVSKMTRKKIQEEVEEWLEREEEIRKNHQDRPSSGTSKIKASKKSKKRKIVRPEGGDIDVEIQSSIEPSEETEMPETTSRGDDVRVEQETAAERTEPEPHESPRSRPVSRGSHPSAFPENPGPSINLWEMIQKRRAASPRKGRTHVAEKRRELEQEQNDSETGSENSLFDGDSGGQRDERETEEEEIENSLFDEDLKESGDEIQEEEERRTSTEWTRTSQQEDIMGQGSWDSENFQEEFDEIMDQGSSGYDHGEDELGGEEVSQVESSSKWPRGSSSPIWSVFNSEGESEVDKEPVGQSSIPGTPMISDPGSEGELEAEEAPVKWSLGPRTPTRTKARIEEQPEAEKVGLKGSSGPGRPMGSKNKPKQRPVIERRNPVRQKRPRSEEDEDFDIGKIVVDLSPKKKVRKEVEKKRKSIQKNKGKDKEIELEELRESALQREKLDRVFKNLERDLKAFAEDLTKRKEDGRPHFVRWLDDINSLIKQEPMKVKDVLANGVPQRLFTLLGKFLDQNQDAYPIYLQQFRKTFKSLEIHSKGS